jgi:hypothetical protein
MGGNATPRSTVAGLGLIEGNYFECEEKALHLGYPGWQVFRNNVFRATTYKGLAGVGHTGVATGMVFEGNDIRGYIIGILAPTADENRIAGNTIQAPCGIFVDNTYQDSRRLVIEGNTFLDAPAAVLTAQRNAFPVKQQGGKQMDVCGVYRAPTHSLYSDFGFNWYLFFGSPNDVHTQPDVMMVDGKYYFLPEEGRTWLHTGSLAFNAMPALKTRTTGQIWDEYGLALGGVLLPEDAAPAPRILGLLAGTDRTRLPALVVNKNPTNSTIKRFYQQTNLTTGFVLKVKDAAGTFREFGPFDLAPGWNVCRIEIDGYSRGVPVFCDPATAPPAPW